MKSIEGIFLKIKNVWTWKIPDSLVWLFRILWGTPIGWRKYHYLKSSPSWTWAYVQKGNRYIVSESFQVMFVFTSNVRPKTLLPFFYLGFSLTPWHVLMGGLVLFMGNTLNSNFDLNYWKIFLIFICVRKF